MNFVRQIDERLTDSENVLFNTTKAELELVNEFGFKNTFLLQYDAVCDGRYAKLFKENADEKTELGLWYEIVEPLTSACSLPYKSENGWKWDWHIVPGFSMAYTPAERELLINEAMKKFNEVYGYYPKTVASWLIDTHTVNYLTEHYDIDAIAICRDQVNTDAYTLVGGYFNQAYYPSKNNIFTPAQSEEMQTCVPVLRLLSPCPVHNYDSYKYISKELGQSLGYTGCFTLEPVWKIGNNPEYVDWFFATYFGNEDLGFSYAQIGQENSFRYDDFLPDLRMQLEKIKALNGVSVQKMCDTGAWFKQSFDLTPATSIVANSSWDKSIDVQSVYYDCKSYTANLFRYENSIFVRLLYLFDDRKKEHYLTEKCTTFDAIYENLPLVDTRFWTGEEKKNCGLVLDSNATEFTVRKTSNGVLEAAWKEFKIVFDENKITTNIPEMRLYTGEPNCKIQVCESCINYTYKGASYSLNIENADIRCNLDYISILSHGSCTLMPKKA
jgi:hypothetical protein